MEEHKCETCCKVFTMKKNLNQHRRQVHEERKIYECGICSKQFSRRQNKELHLLNCSRKINVQGGELPVKTYKTLTNPKFSPILRKSAFGGCFADWFIKYPGDYRLVDPNVLLQAAAESMKEIIKDHLYKHTKRLKFTMSIHVVFEQATSPEVKTVPPVVLTTNPYDVWPITDLDECLTNAAKELFDKIETYEGYGSGWIIDYLDRLDTNIASAYTGL